MSKPIDIDSDEDFEHDWPSDNSDNSDTSGKGNESAWEDDQFSSENDFDDEEDSDFTSDDEKSKKKKKQSTGTKAKKAAGNTDNAKKRKPVTIAANKVAKKPKATTTKTATTKTATTKTATTKTATTKKTPSKPKTNVKSVSETAAMEIIKEYILSNNKPFTPNILISNLQSRGIKKNLVQPILDKISIDIDEINDNIGFEIVKKEIGKTKLYFPNQKIFSSSENVETIQNQIQNLLQNDLKNLKTTISSLSNAKNKLGSTLTTDQIEKHILEFEKEKKEKITKLEKIKENTSNNKIDADLLKNIESKLTHLIKEWKKRKNATEALVDIMLEGNEAFQDYTIESFMEYLGIETDKSLDVSIKNIQELLKKPTIIKPKTVISKK